MNTDISITIFPYDPFSIKSGINFISFQNHDEYSSIMFNLYQINLKINPKKFGISELGRRFASPKNERTHVCSRWLAKELAAGTRNKQQGSFISTSGYCVGQTDGIWRLNPLSPHSKPCCFLKEPPATTHSIWL